MFSFLFHWIRTNRWLFFSKRSMILRCFSSVSNYAPRTFFCNIDRIYFFHEHVNHCDHFSVFSFASCCSIQVTNFTHAAVLCKFKSSEWWFNSQNEEQRKLEQFTEKSFTYSKHPSHKFRGGRKSGRKTL